MIKLDKVNFLVGDSKVFSQISLPFEKLTVDFIDELSKKINNYKHINNFPDLQSAAFFCRKANLLNLKKRYLINNQLRVGRGLLFHIAPANAPTNFLYSLIFGLLTGNSNIVKVSSKKFEQVEIICLLINKLLKKYKKISSFIKIIRYDNINEEITKKISKLSDARIIWGGDKTIESIKKFELKNRGVDISFADRYSVCFINSNKFHNLSKEKKKLLVNNFYNDTFTLDQNACSSPHLIFWYGANIRKNKDLFWTLLADITKKRYNLMESSVVNKYMQICKNLIQNDNIKELKNYNNNIYTLLLKKLKKDITNYRGQWGYFYEFHLKNFQELEKIDTEKIQTITYFGFNNKELKKNILNYSPKGIDRVVPIGQALDIDFIWDGYDIYNFLTRIVDIK